MERSSMGGSTEWGDEVEYGPGPTVHTCWSMWRLEAILLSSLLIHAPSRTYPSMHIVKLKAVIKVIKLNVIMSRNST
jgi:hypothetical protein